jgi:hypothetical protein
MNSLPIRFLCVSLLLMASSVIVSAQGRISVAGRVVDQTGAAVGAATVTARQLGASFERSANTGEDGAYRIDDLMPGDYQVSASREGFSIAAQTLTIQYITRNPQEKFSGSLTLLGGNRNYFNGYANASATLGRTGFLFDFLRKQGEGARENMRLGIYDVLIKSVTKLTEDGRQTLGFKFNYYGEGSNVTYSGLTLAEFIANPRANPFRNDFFDGDRFGGSATYTNAINSRAVFTATIYGSDFNRDWWRQSSNSDQRPNRRGFNGCAGMAELNTLCGNEGRLRNYDAFGVDPRLKISSRAGETDIGFRYHRETQNRIQQNNNTGGPNGRSGVTVEDNLRRNDAVSGYIQHRFMFGKFAVTPGLRVEHVNIERTNQLGTPVTGKTDVRRARRGRPHGQAVQRRSEHDRGLAERPARIDPGVHGLERGGQLPYRQAGTLRANGILRVEEPRRRHVHRRSAARHYGRHSTTGPVRRKDPILMESSHPRLPSYVTLSPETVRGGAAQSL